jgi:hypothetical protein
LAANSSCLACAARILPVRSLTLCKSLQEPNIAFSSFGIAVECKCYFEPLQRNFSALDYHLAVCVSIYPQLGCRALLNDLSRREHSNGLSAPQFTTPTQASRLCSAVTSSLVKISHFQINLRVSCLDVAHIVPGPYAHQALLLDPSGVTLDDSKRGHACSKRHRASPDYGEGGRGSPHRNRELRHGGKGRAAGPGGIEYISEFIASRHGMSDESDDEDDRPAVVAAVGEGHLEALPGSIDPAAAGGPVALPAAGSIMRGRTRYTEAERSEERQRGAVARQRITMNRAGGISATVPGVSAAGLGGAAKAESRQERLRRLTAAQFNSSVARDTKRVLDKRAREADDRRAREAIERSALALPPAPPDPKGRGADRRECVSTCHDLLLMLSQLPRSAFLAPL